MKTRYYYIRKGEYKKNRGGIVVKEFLNKMKEILKKELSNFSIIKSIRFSDFNLSALIIALIITIVNLITKNWIPTIGGFGNSIFVLILIVALTVMLNNRVEKRVLNAFICIETLLVALNYLLTCLFPNSIQFVKEFISLYVLFSIFIFILGQLYQPTSNNKNEEVEN